MVVDVINLQKRVLRQIQLHDRLIHIVTFVSLRRELKTLITLESVEMKMKHFVKHDNQKINILNDYHLNHHNSTGLLNNIFPTHSTSW